MMTATKKSIKIEDRYNCKTFYYKKTDVRGALDLYGHKDVDVNNLPEELVWTTLYCNCPMSTASFIVANCGQPYRVLNNV